MFISLISKYKFLIDLLSIFDLVLKVKELRKPFLDHIKFIILSVNN